MDHSDIVIELPEAKKGSPMVVAIMRRHGLKHSVQKFRHRADRRSKDARRHWSREEA